MLIKKAKIIPMLLMGAFLLTSCSESSIYSTTEEDKSSPTIQPKAKSMNGLEDQRNLTPNSMKSLEDINDALQQVEKIYASPMPKPLPLQMEEPRKPVKRYMPMTDKSVLAHNGYPAMYGAMLMETI